MPVMRGNLEQVTISIEPEQVRKIRGFAADKNLSLTKMIRELLKFATESFLAGTYESRVTARINTELSRAKDEIVRAVTQEGIIGEIKKQANRLASLLIKDLQYSITTRYEVNYLIQQALGEDKMMEITRKCWTTAIRKIKEKEEERREEDIPI